MSEHEKKEIPADPMDARAEPRPDQADPAPRVVDAETNENVRILMEEERSSGTVPPPPNDPQIPPQDTHPKHLTIDPVQDAEPEQHLPLPESQASSDGSQPEEQDTDEPPTETQTGEEGDYIDESKLFELIAGAVGSAVGDQLGDIERRLGNINQRMKENRDSVQVLFEENKQSRGGVETALLVPMFKGLLKTLEKMTLEHDRAERSGDTTLATNLDVFRVDLLNTLEDFGLEQEPTTDVSDHPRMDPRTQTIVDTKPGADELHKRVHRVVAPAYSYKGTRFTKEQVIVYKRQSGATQQEI